MINELNLDIDKFKAWLNERNDDVAGWACTGGDCPLARYIKVTHLWVIRSSVTVGDEIQDVIINVNGHEYKVLTNEEILAQFVLQLDNAYPMVTDQIGNKYPTKVTGLQALAVLESL